MLLDKIDGPKELKMLRIEDLPVLAEEIREEIIKTVSVNGGHLASSLGAVELAIALHYHFNSPKDVVIWDVGHQSYAHKLLTGRRKRFNLLRKYQGIHGFPFRQESDHDTLSAGHASTAISAALGVIEAFEMQNRKNHVIAVVGDGSLTGGLAFEGLNHTGQLKNRLIVILNDNAMSISPSVGGLSAWFSQQLSGRAYGWGRKKVKKILKFFPNYGPSLDRVIKKMLKTSIVLFTPGILFEGLGFNYIGPLDGHNTEELLEVFSHVTNMGYKSPVLIHLRTKKGKGFLPAEKNPSAYHGVAATSTRKDKGKKKPPSYTEVFSQSLIKLARVDRRIVAITAAMSDGTGLEAFRKEFPNRFYDVGIAEGHAVTFASGLASQGILPVIAIYSTFLQRGYDQILHDACLQNFPLIFVLDRGGIVGEDGPTHQGIFDLSYLRHCPNLSLMSPADENELQHMLYSATRYNRIIAIRFPRGSGPGVSLDSQFEEIPFGKPQIIDIDKEGHNSEILLLAIGNMVVPAIKAGDLLMKKNIKAQVVNARFVKPLDLDAVLNNFSGNKIVTLEENVLAGGFGSSILEQLTKKGIKDYSIMNIGIPDKFVEPGDSNTLRKIYRLDSDSLAEDIYDFCQRS